jgi:hypothetical protein
VSYCPFIDDDEDALDVFHEQFAVYGSATHIAGPLSAATLKLLTLAQGRAALKLSVVHSGLSK